MNFTEGILEWHKTIDRKLPWKKTNDPYKIWISEIVLQQTRIEQGTPYYLRLIEQFPTVFDLAAASEDQLLSHWKGLGYYSRARNMLKAAKIIVKDYQGVFPNTKESIEQLPGVGPYTAAAISSFAYSLPYAVVDGNVYRVLSRMYGMHVPINSTDGKKQFANLAQQLLAHNQPAAYNQAIMDFGALCCRPKNPDCICCPLSNICAAYQQGLVYELPKKEKKLKRRKRYFLGCVIEHNGTIMLEKRLEKDIWRGLYTIPLLESMTDSDELAAKSLINSHYGVPADTIEHIADKKQKLTHQDIFISFYSIPPKKNNSKHMRIGADNYADYATPRVVDEFLLEYFEMQEKL